MSEPLSRQFEDLSVVIPAFNEVNGIAATLDQLGANLPGAEVIVVDDGSTDGTADVVRKYPWAKLLQHDFNRGYGAALKTGMAAAQRDLVAWFDADNEHRVSDLISMVESLRGQKLAAMIGQRTHGGASAVRGIGKAVILMLARSLGFRGGRDMNCGLRVFRTDVINRYLPLLPNGYSASITSLMTMLERGYPIGYHPVELGKRIGSSKVTLRAGFQSLFLVMRVIMLFAPMRIFLPAALAFLISGGAYGLIVAVVRHEGFPIFSLFLLLAGVVIGMLGLIADQLSQIRLAQYETAIPRRTRERQSDLRSPSTSP